MRCNGFCFCTDPLLFRDAEREAGRIDRKRTGSPVSLELEAGSAVALPLDDDCSLPLVHGWSGNGKGDVEASVMAASGRSLAFSRDIVGSRPVYAGKGGDWVATDHRFIRGRDWTLIPPGSSYELSSKLVMCRDNAIRRYRGTFDDAATELATEVEAAVRERVSGKRTAVAFSGGLDSSILAFCAKKHSKVLGVTVRASNSRDRVSAPRAAEALGIEILEVDLEQEIVDNELRAIDLPFEPTAMDKSLWCIYTVASRTAFEAGAEMILLGQLADELFGGYMKYLKSLEVDGEGACRELMEADIQGCGSRGFLRDEAACSRWIEPSFPFADERVVGLGSSLPVDFAIKDGVRKAVLRQAARLMGVPEELCNSPKKAAQYSSGALKLVE